MHQSAAANPRLPIARIQQTVKWTVYTLLVVNFFFYIGEDVGRAAHTLDRDASLLDWTAEFATTIEILAWLLLLFMFELETYLVEDDDWSPWKARLVHGVRILCYLMIGHTLYAYSAAVADLQPTLPVTGIAGLCSLADAGVSYVYNLEYTVVTAANCGTLTEAGNLFWLTQGTLVTDAEGLALERALAAVDVVEISSWLVIVLLIETLVRLQNRGITGGPLIATANGVQLALYLVLIGIAIYWASLSHWLYFWDEMLWIGGFAVIEMNLSEWRREEAADASA